MIIVAIMISAALIVVSYQYEKAQYDKFQQALSTLRSTHKLYKNMVNDIDLLDKYRNLYSGYRASGLVGKERRLSWVESLESTNEVLRLPTLTYSLHPQEDFNRPGFILKRGINVQSSPMELTMGLLHEEDLFALLEGLRLSIKNLFTVDQCLILRQGSGGTLDTKNANLTTQCTIRWVTINAK
jgi:type II secretory pathway pseudopilin PulG